MRGRRSFHQSRACNARWTPTAAAILIALGGVATTAANAQTTPAEAPAAGPLQEIVVTATRHEESLSKVPISVTALTQESLDLRGIKDIQDVARFTPGVNIDNSGTGNIAIRGIASSGGAGTTGIYIDDTPIQMRALAFDPDEAIPKSFDVDRIEVLRGPQGTLFGAGSEGGTVRYITTQPSLTKTSIYSRDEVSFTRGGDPSYEAGFAVGGPLVEGTFGARATVWYRHDGGWIDRVDPTNNPPNVVLDKRANYQDTILVRLAAIWAASDRVTLAPSVYYQDRKANDVSTYWPLYSDPSNHHYVNGNPSGRPTPDKFYLPALKIEADLGAARLISNTSYFHRDETTGYEGTLYNLGFYQTFMPGPGPLPLLDENGIHLPGPVANYRSPASVDNGQMNFTQEVRLQSNDSNAAWVWTTGVFFSSNRQSYLEQIHDPMLPQLTQFLTGNDVPTEFGVGYDPNYPEDSYFLRTHAKDQQLAWFGESTFHLNDRWGISAGARFANSKYSFDTLTGGPQLFGPTIPGTGSNNENSFTPKLGIQFQADPSDLYYATYAKGFRPGGANNPVPYAACAADFANLGIPGAPATYNSDTVQSYELGAKNNIQGAVRIASSVYYIKWHNIQQTVVPPICQISFIANLGEAVAKGADVQADFALGEHLTADLSAGYTDARFTRDSRLSASEITPIVANGDSIVGENSTGTNQQPGAPFTASAGIEYKFAAFERDAFVRIDDEYASHSKWLPANQDSKTLQFDQANFQLPATNFVTLRAGMSFGKWQIAAFCDNLTDTHPLTSYNYTIGAGGGDTRLRRDFTLRPRTLGLTFTFRD